MCRLGCGHAGAQGYYVEPGSPTPSELGDVWGWFILEHARSQYSQRYSLGGSIDVASGYQSPVTTCLSCSFIYIIVVTTTDRSFQFAPSLLSKRQYSPPASPQSFCFWLLHLGGIVIDFSRSLFEWIFYWYGIDGLTLSLVHSTWTELYLNCKHAYYSGIVRTVNAIFSEGFPETLDSSAAVKHYVDHVITTIIIVCVISYF